MQQHLQTGINRMLPFVVAGALCAAFAPQAAPGSFLAGLLQALGPEGGLALIFPVLAGFIAYSIAGWDGFLPGAVGGLLAARGGSGMFGAIFAGFLAGYAVTLLIRVVRVPAVVADLKPILILPVLSTLLIGVVMISVVNPPLSFVMQALQGLLMGMRGESAIILGFILGGMGAFDLGGPVNKAASLFALDLLAIGIAEPLGAVVAGVLVASTGLYLAMRLAPSRFSPEEQKLGVTAFLLGLFNICEGVIPVAMRDPGRVIPAVTLGGAVAGAISLAAGVAVRLPVGGFFTILLPGMVTGAGSYLLAIGAGSAVTALTLLLLKPSHLAVKDEA